MRRLFIVLALVAAALVPARAQQGMVWPGTTTATPTPPPIIPRNVVYNTNNGSTVDPGASPNAEVAFAELWQNSDATPPPANAPTCVSPCNLARYQDFLVNHCSTVLENTVMTNYAATPAPDESVFLHTYASGKVINGRMGDVNSSNTTCSAYYQGPAPSPSPFAKYFNPGSSGFNTYMAANIWNNTTGAGFPSPYGVYEDQGGITCQYIVGIGSNNALFPSWEYSQGFNSGTTLACNVVGPNNTIDYDDALVAFSNGAAPLPMMLNGFSILSTGANKPACSVIVGTHCNDQFSTGFIDDRYNYDDFCKDLVGTNFVLGDTENTFMGKAEQLATPNGILAMLNTLPSFHAKCRNWKLSDYEYPFGTGGPGSPVPSQTAEIQFRTEVFVAHILIPSPVTQTPSRFIYHYTTLGSIAGSATEFPYFFEESLTPWVSETPVAQFTWNGRTQTIGGGCGSDVGAGDAHGALDLLVACDPTGNGGIYCQQYVHLYINGADKGAMAACLDTSTAAENYNPTIASGWFRGDSWTTYNHILTLTHGELKTVPDSNVGGTLSFPTCTDANNCVTYPAAGTETATWSTGAPGTACGSNTPPCGFVLTSSALP